ncbi:MAG: hypothetical protein IJU76_14730 [Desulfovibrionaceae bacterium]|nr:hypothetical protein [Desulfovibrionaceae bacterium]
MKGQKSEFVLFEFLETVQAVFASLDLVEPKPCADGALHRCATVHRPNKKNGAYIVRTIPFPWVWARNWETLSDAVACGAGCGKALRERACARVQQSRESLRRRVADKAKYLWNTVFSWADETNPYLVKKGIPGIGVKETRDGTLVVPVYDDQELVSMQFISASAGKRFLKGGKIQSCFFPLPARDRSVLCIAEGYATGVSIHVATGYGVLCAFGCGNLIHVAKSAKRRFPEATLCLCADYDSPSRIYPHVGGIGFAKAREAALAVRGYVAYPFEGCRTGDFNDLHKEYGLESVRRALARRFLV